MSFLFRRGKTVYYERGKANEVPVGMCDFEDILHLFITIGPFGPMGAFMGYHPDTHITYLCEQRIHAEAIREAAQGGDFAIYPARVPLGGPGSIKMFWSRRKALQGVVAAAQWYSGRVFPPGVTAAVATSAELDQPPKLSITHMSVRAPWRRNRLNTLMIEYLVSHTEVQRENVVYHDLTKDGKAFVEWRKTTL